MNEADALEFLGYLFAAYASGWALGFLQMAFKRYTEIL